MLTNRRLEANAVFIYFICMMLLFLLTACGDNSKGTGSIAFSLRIQEFQDAGDREFAATFLPHNQARGSVEKKSPVSVHLNSPAIRLSGLARYASLFGPSAAFAHSPGEAIDCERHQIDKIVAYVYDEKGREIARGGPWSCDLHGGSMRVPAGVNLTLKLYAIEICSEEKIFYGEKGGPDEPLIVRLGETTDVGLIVLERIFNSWQLSTIDPAIGCINGYYDASLATSIDISTKDDSVHIAYFDCGDNAIKYATNASGSWEIETVDESGLGYTSIALDSDGLPHVAYIGYGQWENYALYYATRNESGLWNSVSAYSESDFSLELRSTSIAIRSDSATKFADISCITSENRGSLLFVSCPVGNEECSSNVLGAGDDASIALDSENLAHIGYSEPQYSGIDVKHRKKIPSGEWQSPDVLDTVNPTEGIVRTAIALDLDDTVHISYCDLWNSELKYISGVSQNWSQPDIVECLYSGSGCNHHAIAVDPAGKVHITYYDDYDGVLKYATGTSGCWKFHIVDSSGNAGLNNSIAVDSNDNVHISYYDAYNDVLKYAMRTIQR
jgi:hypothetical protein